MHQPFIRSALVAGVLLLGACTALHLPWRRPAAPVPAPVSELIVEAAAGQAAPRVLQYWDRNTLRLDLTALAGSGTLQLRAQPPNGWPVRLSFTVKPGNFRTLEVRGEQRVQFTVAASGEPQTLALSAGVYSKDSASIILRWQ